MDDEKTIILGLLVTAFFFGMLFMMSGLADVNSALDIEQLTTDPIGSLSSGGTGSLKAIIGLVLVIAVIAPKSLRVIFQR